MNERIKELAEQAITEKLSIDEFIEALKKEPYDFYGFRFSELQKFAELIVRECAGVVEGGSFLHDQAPTAIFARECSGAIKRHFGVEE